VEESFGGMKTVGGFERTRYRGRDLPHLAASWVGAADPLLRVARLDAGKVAA
jgi:hypothetical protein